MYCFSVFYLLSPRPFWGSVWMQVTCADRQSYHHSYAQHTSPREAAGSETRAAGGQGGCMGALQAGVGGGGGNADSLCSDMTYIHLVRNEWVSD